MTRDENGLFILYVDGVERARNQNPASAGALQSTLRTLGCEASMGSFDSDPFRGRMDERIDLSSIGLRQAVTNEFEQHEGPSSRD